MHYICLYKYCQARVQVGPGRVQDGTRSGAGQSRSGLGQLHVNSKSFNIKVYFKSLRDLDPSLTTRQLAVLTFFKNTGNDASLPRAANAASKCIQINSNAATAAVAQEQGTSFFFMHSLSSCVSLSSRNFLSVSTHL